MQMDLQPQLQPFDNTGLRTFLRDQQARLNTLNRIIGTANERIAALLQGCRLSEGCYSFNEAMTLAAAHLKQTGRAGLAHSLWQQGWTVRQLLRSFTASTPGRHGMTRPNAGHFAGLCSAAKKPLIDGHLTWALFLAWQRPIFIRAVAE